MRILKQSLLTAFIFLVQTVAGQSDSTLLEIIKDSTVMVLGIYDEGTQQIRFGEKEIAPYLGFSSAEVLKREAGIFIKEYGSGLLSTITHRGGSAAQTSVLWEGINLMNPMLGQSDLSLMPLAFVDNLSWQSGGNSALNGNNAIGGSLKISSRTEFNSGLKTMALIQTGSFGDFRQQFRIQYGNDSYAGSLRLFYQRADNDYYFRDSNAFGNPKPLKKLTNAAQESWGLMQENSIRTAKNGILSWQHWYQQSFRQIPPKLLQTVGDNEQQFDRASRNILSWRSVFYKFLIKTDAAYIYEELNYNNNVLSSRSKIHNPLLRLELSFFHNSQYSISTLFENQYQYAISDNYKKGQNSFSAALSFKINRKKWILNLNAREMIVDSRPLLPGLSANYRKNFGHNIFESFSTSVSQNFRYPTLNDRFWPIGGNPNLKPEYSWSGDFKFRIKTADTAIKTKLDLGAYANFVKNWIQWTPSNFGFWEPENLSNVLGFGPEISAKLAYNYKKQHFEIMSNYQLNRARRILETDPVLENRQLIYTPEHCLNAGFDWTFSERIHFLYRHNFYSRRYLDNGNQNWLPSYHTAYTRLDWNFKIRQLSISLSGIIDNVWGTEYQAVANRPMPVRSFSIALLFKY
jgi:iron complex outermembrane receptor protein